MKLQCKCLPKYFDMIKSGKKTADFRQFEEIEFENKETGEIVRFEVRFIYPITAYKTTKEAHPDVPWVERLCIYRIELGKQL